MKKNTAKDYAIALYEITKELKGNALDRAIQEFAALLVKRRQLKQIKPITEEFVRHAKKLGGVVEVKLTTARKLDKITIAAIKQAFGDNVESEEKIDESLFGGFIAKTEDKIFDASLKTQLNKLRHNLSR